jgi:hypothetical protein
LNFGLLFVIVMKKALGNSTGVILNNAVENRFTAKPPRAQRTYSKKKNHLFGLFGEATDHLDVDSNPCFPWRLCAFAVEVLS